MCDSLLYEASTTCPQDVLCSDIVLRPQFVMKPSSSPVHVDPSTDALTPLNH